MSLLDPVREKEEVMEPSVPRGTLRMVHGAGKAASLLVLAIMATVSWEVVARYVFNAPTTWVWLVNKQIFGIYILVGGGYALVEKSHIRIELFYERFPKVVKGFVRWLSLACAAGFLGCLVWKGWAMGMEAWHTGEKAIGLFRLPLYPLKMFIPVGALLFLAACLAGFARRR